MNTRIAQFPHPRLLLVAALVLMLAVVAVLAAASGGGASGTAQVRAVTLTATDLSFDPANLTLTAGQPVRLTLVNHGSLDHDVTIPGLNATDEIVEPVDEGGGDHHMMGNMVPGTVHMAALRGERVTVEFTPRAGMFNLYCSVPGHREAGMVGNMVVR